MKAQTNSSMTQHALEISLLHDALTNALERHAAVEAQADALHAMTTELLFWMTHYKRLLKRTHAFLQYIDTHEAARPAHDGARLGFDVLVQQLREAASMIPEGDV